MKMRIAAIAIVAFALTPMASAEPSFDCSKVHALAEKTICATPDLQWFDRQLTRLFKLARAQHASKQGPLIAAQRAFLTRRDACKADSDCIESAYKARLAELARQVNVTEAYAEFRPRVQGGSLFVVRYGFDAAFKFLTVGGNGHTCWIESDGAPQRGKGVVRYRETGANACRIDLIPDGDEIVVETRNCSDYCGVRAVLDDRYARVK